jgi:hypothetical protein
MTIDFEAYFRNRIENMLIRASWVSDIRRMLGLRGASQIWSSHPQWYFWLQDAPGTYCLSFVEGDVVHVDGNDLYEGRFALKCYPHIDSAGYGGYTLDERHLRQSDHFDDTGTPRFEIAAAMSNSLFVVASITFLSDPQGSFALLTFESLDALKIFKIEASQCGSHFYTSITRNVPGWEHGWPLFDCLVGLYAYCFHQPPIFMGATTSRGFEYIVSPDGIGEYRSAAETTRLALTIGFGAPEGKAYARAQTHWKMNLETGEEIIVSQRLFLSSFNGVCHAMSKPFKLNPKWWDAAGADFRSELSSLCGCTDGHCHHLYSDPYSGKQAGR